MINNNSGDVNGNFRSCPWPCFRTRRVPGKIVDVNVSLWGPQTSEPNA